MCVCIFASSIPGLISFGIKMCSPMVALHSNFMLLGTMYFMFRPVRLLAFGTAVMGKLTTSTNH